MLVWKEFAAWRSFFRWLGTPIRKYRRRKEEERQREEFYKNVKVTVVHGPGRIYTPEEIAEINEQERPSRRKKKK